jgi:glycerol-3-phosphate dehydrogenase (NAD(P)+)
MSDRIVVIGTGAWGTALGLSMHRAGNNVLLYGRRQEFIEELAQTRKSRYLPNIQIDSDLTLSANTQDIKSAKLIFWVAPTQPTAELLAELTPHIAKESPIVLCSKGLYLKTQQTLSEVFKTQLNNPIGVLSGPNFADEVANNLPAASTLAFDDVEIAKQIAAEIRHRNLRVYAYDDVKGVELCGALKNVMAIAAGIVTGKNLGYNCLASLITRASAEINRIVCKLGGKKETTQTLAGIGDLILTCSSTKSRNSSLGEQLAQGKTLDEILKERFSITEGVPTTQVAYELAKKNNIHAPIITAVHDILYNNANIDLVVDQLLNNQQDFEII